MRKACAISRIFSTMSLAFKLFECSAEWSATTRTDKVKGGITGDKRSQLGVFLCVCEGGKGYLRNVAESHNGVTDSSIGASGVHLGLLVRRLLAPIERFELSVSSCSC